MGPCLGFAASGRNESLGGAETLRLEGEPARGDTSVIHTLMLIIKPVWGDCCLLTVCLAAAQCQGQRQGNAANQCPESL